MEIPLEDGPRRHYIGVRGFAINQIQWDYFDPKEVVRRQDEDTEVWEVADRAIQAGDFDSGELEGLLTKAFDLGYRMADHMNDRVGL